MLELNAAFSIYAKLIGERFRILVYAKHTLKTAFSMSSKMMSALAFVPVSDVYSVFSEFLRVHLRVPSFVQSFCDRENFRRKFF